MWQDLDLLTLELNLTTLLNGGIGGLWALKLNVAESSALTILEGLNLAGADFTKLGKGLAELSLRDGWLKVLDEDIGLWVDEVVLLDGTTNI